MQIVQPFHFNTTSELSVWMHDWCNFQLLQVSSTISAAICSQYWVSLIIYQLFETKKNNRVPLCKYSQHVNCTSFLLMDFNYAGCHCPTPCSELGPVHRSTIVYRYWVSKPEPRKSTKRQSIIQKCMKTSAKKLTNWCAIFLILPWLLFEYLYQKVKNFNTEKNRIMPFRNIYRMLAVQWVWF